MTSIRPISSSNNISLQTHSQAYIPVTAKGHKESVYALAMNESGSLLVSGGTEKVYFCLLDWFEYFDAQVSVLAKKLL